MTKADKARWLTRAKLKVDLLQRGVKHVSGVELNLSAGLPADAVWRVGNFG